MDDAAESAEGRKRRRSLESASEKNRRDIATILATEQQKVIEEREWTQRLEKRVQFLTTGNASLRKTLMENDELSKEKEALTLSLRDDLARSGRDLAQSNAEKKRERELADSLRAGLAESNAEKERDREEGKKRQQHLNEIIDALASELIDLKKNGGANSLELEEWKENHQREVVTEVQRIEAGLAVVNNKLASATKEVQRIETGLAMANNKLASVTKESEDLEHLEPSPYDTAPDALGDGNDDDDDESHGNSITSSRYSIHQNDDDYNGEKSVHRDDGDETYVDSDDEEEEDDDDESHGNSSTSSRYSIYQNDDDYDGEDSVHYGDGDETYEDGDDSDDEEEDDDEMVDVSIVDDTTNSSCLSSQAYPW
jgi:O6-methylguanine-DNA--protein-cysteine methyltransferase